MKVTLRNGLKWSDVIILISIDDAMFAIIVDWVRWILISTGGTIILTGTAIILVLRYLTITGRKRSFGKVMFLHLPVSRSAGGGEGVSRDRDRPGQRPAMDRDQLDRDLPGQRPSWTETLLDRDPAGQRPPGQRPPWTETPVNRDPPGQRLHGQRPSP